MEKAHQLMRAPDIALELLADESAQLRLEAYRTALRVERAKLVRAAAVELANLQWGQQLSEVARAAVARWALEAGIDPLRHIYILGGRIYDNAELYIDKLAAMPSFDHAEIELVAPLDRRDFSKAKLGASDRAELERKQELINSRRLLLQMQYGVPAEINEFPATAAAALVHLLFRDGTTAFGCNWAGSMGKKKRRRNKQTGQMVEGGPRDPVGDESPVKTAITRAYRKAAKQKIPLWPWLRVQTGEDALVGVEHVIEQGRAAAKRMAPEGTSTEIAGVGHVLTQPHEGAVHSPTDVEYEGREEPADQPAEDGVPRVDQTEQQIRQEDLELGRQ